MHCNHIHVWARWHDYRADVVPVSSALQLRILRCNPLGPSGFDPVGCVLLVFRLCHPIPDSNVASDFALHTRRCQGNGLIRFCELMQHCLHCFFDC